MADVAISWRRLSKFSARNRRGASPVRWDRRLHNSAHEVRPEGVLVCRTVFVGRWNVPWRTRRNWPVNFQEKTWNISVCAGTATNRLSFAVSSVTMQWAQYTSFFCPHTTGHYAWMAVVCPSVPCLTLSREWKGIGNWKLAERKPMTRGSVTPFRGQTVKSQGHQAA